MKLKIFMFLVFFSLLFSSVSMAQKPFYLSVGTGLSIPMSESDFTDAFNTGFNVHASGTFFINNNIGFRGDIQYNRFPLDESDPDYSGDFTVTTVKGDFLAGNFVGNVNPYGLIGMGASFISASLSANNTTVSQSETNFGVGLGGGINFSVSQSVSLYGEIQYNFISNDGSAKGYLPIKFGAMFKIN